MKSIYKTIKLYSSVLLLTGALAGCSEYKMDEINKDNDHTQDAPAKFILTDVITATAFSNVGGDLNTYMSSYIEHEVGIYNQLWNAETRAGEVTSSTTFNNVWGGLYSNLKNARLVINKCAEGGSQSGNYTTKGMGEVLAAINSALLADAFGDIPFSQASLPLVNGKPQFMNPEVDSQESVYNAIFKYLDDAIADLPKGDNHVSGGVSTQDLLYGADEEKWMKLAYGLKARYTMRLINKSSDQTADLNKILEYIDKSFTGTGDEAAFAIYDVTNVNPSFDFFDSREYMAASTSMSKKLIERNDPRLRRVYVNAINRQGRCTQLTGNTDELFLMAPNGTPLQSQRYYNTSIFGMSQTAPTMLMSYHELLFLKAEAMQRLGKPAAEVAEALKAAVVAGIANTERSVAAALRNPVYSITPNGTEAITADEAKAYFDEEIAPRLATDPLKEIMIQKYIALWGASGESTETYNDVRRLKAEGKEYYDLENPGKFPLRCPYGADDTTANPNVEVRYGDGQYVYSEQVWWAGGTR